MLDKPPLAKVIQSKHSILMPSHLNVPHMTFTILDQNAKSKAAKNIPLLPLVALRRYDYDERTAIVTHQLVQGR